LAFQSTSGTPLGLYLAEALNLTEQALFWFNTSLTLSLFLCAVVLLLYPNRLMLLLLFIYALLLAWFTFINSTQAFHNLVFLAQAMRLGTPIVLLILIVSPLMDENLSHLKKIFLFTCIVSMSTFATHGWEAIQHHPKFIQLISGSAERLFHLSISEEATLIILTLIGITDIITGFSIVLYPHRYVALWMALWGFITAMSRVTAFGWDAIGEVLVRGPHFILPMAIYAMLRRFRYAD
jgi:hypothetical protein